MHPSNGVSVSVVNSTMKAFTPTFLFLTAVLFLSCDNDDINPAREQQILPLRLELDDYKREFTFDGQSRITSVKNLSFYPGDVVLETNIQYVYGPGGKLEKTVNDQGYRLEYTYDGNRIARTDEYLNNEFTQYHTFSYDAEGRLQEYSTWQDVAEWGGVVPKTKEVYLYDSRDNLSHQFIYIYNSAIQGHELLTSFEFSDYDNYPEAESLFDAHALNPNAVFRKNNPGKMITKNRLGNTGMIDQYTYVYDSRGYATEKTTTVTYSYNGNSGSYKTHFFYQAR